MEFLVAALFVLFIINFIIIQIQSDKIRILRSEMNSLRNSFKIYADIVKISFKDHKKYITDKMQNEKIRTEEFVHGVYKDYTNYIDTKWMNAVNAILEESKKAKTKPIIVKSKISKVKK